MNEELHPCPCCREATISEPGGYEICEICGWEDDESQHRIPGTAGGANLMSLDEARAYWNATRTRTTWGQNSPEMHAVRLEAQRLLRDNQ